jgi:hypothetical protein
MADHDEPRGWVFDSNKDKPEDNNVEEPTSPAPADSTGAVPPQAPPSDSPSTPLPTDPPQPYQPSYDQGSSDQQSVQSIFDLAVPTAASQAPSDSESYTQGFNYGQATDEKPPTSAKKRIVIIGSVLFGLIALTFIGIYAYRSLTGSTSGSATPEAVVETALSSLENKDLLGAARQVDPNEIEPFIENYEVFTTELKENNEISNTDEPLEAFEYSVEGLETKTVMYSEDVARVELVSGVITQSVDESKLPEDAQADEYADETLNIADENEKWRNGELLPWPFSTDKFNEDDLESDNIFYVAVNRDGRWYFSALYTMAETIRISGNAAGGDYEQPEFDALARSGNGAANPEDATVNFIETLFGLNVEDFIKSTAPQRFSVAHDYLELLTKVDERNKDNEFVVAARDAVEVSDITTDQSSEGDGRTFVGVNSIAINLEYELDVDENSYDNFTFIPYKINAQAQWDGQCVTYEGLYSTYQEDATFYDDEPTPMPPYDEELGIDYQPTYRSQEEGVNEKECYQSGEIPDIGVVTIEEDGKHFVSPIDTIWHYVISTFENS